MEYKNYKVVYRRYASLYFIMAVDNTEVSLNVATEVLGVSISFPGFLPGTSCHLFRLFPSGTQLCLPVKCGTEVIQNATSLASRLSARD